ncbi:MAG TPA: hypothetical protein DEZ27_08120 [Sphaerochaeta sp.]|nr:hypothetical protein [Sphaerochaeta sp.]
MGLLTNIQQRIKDMPPIQTKIATYVTKHSKEVVRMSISHLAQECGAKSEASIVKFYRSLGFTGYHDFKVSLATEIAGKDFHNPDEDSRISSDDDLPSIRNKIFRSCMHVLEMNNSNIDDKVLDKAVSMLSEARRIIIIGYGTSAVACYDLFVKLSRIGIDCHYSTDAHVNALTLSDPKEGDLLFAISYSGESKDVVFQASNVKGLAPIIALTGESGSPLAKVADLCITIDSFETSFHTDAMVGRIVQIAVIDILFTSLAVRGGDHALARLTRARQGLSFIKF